MTWDYTRHYARYHPDTPGHRTGLRALHQRMLGPHLPADRDAAILDVGCGRGYAMEDVAALGYRRIRGIDLDAGQVAHARQRSLYAAHVDDTESFLAGAPGAFSVVLLMDVLEHVPRDRQRTFLTAIAGSLRPGGRLICTVPNAASAIATYWQYRDYTHQHAFTAESLTYLVEHCGFGPARCEGVEFHLRPRFLFWLPTPRTLHWLARCATRLRQRTEFIGELGWAAGREVILTPNVLAVADTPP